ncbi:MAG: NAD(P)-dependent oxidoreductase [Burkholderiaceae bacterium]|nr:NAD(P)-dependent oxidoreductase [Burkholderiaceae bacterium]MBR5458086.1 NAD(P)-dependent oxidoreductase [Burkholderiaceae bacterium]
MTKNYLPTTPKKVAFIGLGNMGFPMAGHLLRAGHKVTVYNRTTTKAEEWVETFGGQMALTPREAAADCDVVFTCVGNDDDLRSVVLGENGVFAGMKPNAILFDCTTDSAMVARELAAVANEKGLRFIDGPVSGGQAGAENGVLTVMCGAAEADFAEAREVAMAFAAAVTRIGEVGCGQLAKMCNQICIAGIVEALSEAIAFGENAGLDMPLVLDVISKGAAQSWQMENRGKTMVKREFDFGFAVDWMRKDLGLCLAEAKKNGSSLPLVEMVDQFYGEVQNLGGRRYDTSSLVMRLPSKK